MKKVLEKFMNKMILGNKRKFVARRAYCSQGLQKSMCVRPDRPSDRPSVPQIGVRFRDKKFRF